MTVPKTLVAVLTYNEGEKLQAVLGAFPDERTYDLLVIDDGSTDETTGFLSNGPHQVIRHDRNRGVGACIRDAVSWARRREYEVIVIMAGNGKMQPQEIPRLLEPIYAGTADYVQGSRYLEGGRSPNLPLFRRIMIRLFTGFVNLATGFPGTDVTCGFRAYRLSVFDHPEINLDQDWLDQYELEYYLHYKVLRYRLRVVEAPVSMVYPKSGRDYSKIRPFVGWWSMIRPWLFLVLRLRK